ncbi:MAG: AMIN-like domain-containing (lipo)protein [Phycicoccus sp.]
MTTRPTATRTRRVAAGILAAAALLTVPTAAGATTARPTTAPATSSCSTAWGSLTKSGGFSDAGIDPLVGGIRAGRHACFDRLVLDVSGVAWGFSDEAILGYDVRYVSTAVQDGSSTPPPVAGGARLAVTVDAELSEMAETPSVTGFRTFRDVRVANSAVDGQTTLALGVRARLPFRVWTTYYDAATDRSKVVIDVAHTW